MRSFQVPVFSDQPLRMPSDAKEARTAFERFWSEPVGERPYLYADVILDSEHYLRHVEFDGGGIAIRFGMNKPTADHPELFGRSVLHSCPIRSFSDGKKYEGKYKEGLFEGQGTMTWSDGRQYVGEWSDGLINGQGTYTWPDGTVEKGIWENGKLTEPN